MFGGYRCNAAADYLAARFGALGQITDWARCCVFFVGCGFCPYRKCDLIILSAVILYAKMFMENRALLLRF